MRVKEVRQKNHLTQKQFADVITENGHKCSCRTVQNIEGKRANPSFDFMASFMRAFPEYTIDEIFFTDEDLK